MIMILYKNILFLIAILLHSTTTCLAGKRDSPNPSPKRLTTMTTTKAVMMTMNLLSMEDGRATDNDDDEEEKKEEEEEEEGGNRRLGDLPRFHVLRLDGEVYQPNISILIFNESATDRPSILYFQNKNSRLDSKNSSERKNDFVNHLSFNIHGSPDITPDSGERFTHFPEKTFYEQDEQDVTRTLIVVVLVLLFLCLAIASVVVCLAIFVKKKFFDSSKACKISKTSLLNDLGAHVV